MCGLITGGGVTEGFVKLLRLRTPHQLSHQNSFGESYSQSIVRLRALRELNAFRSLSVYPVFEDEKSNGSDEKSVKRKIALKKTQRTNIMA